MRTSQLQTFYVNNFILFSCDFCCGMRKNSRHVELPFSGTLYVQSLHFHIEILRWSIITLQINYYKLSFFNKMFFPDSTIRNLWARCSWPQERSQPSIDDCQPTWGKDRDGNCSKQSPGSDKDSYSIQVRNMFVLVKVSLVIR